MRTATVVTQGELTNPCSTSDAAKTMPFSGHENSPPATTSPLFSVRLKQVKTVVTEITKERKSNGTTKTITQWKVRVGSAISEVYSTPTGERELFTLSYWVDGQRKREVFPSKEAAIEAARNTNKDLGSGNLTAPEISPKDRVVCARAVKIVAPYGLAIDDGCRGSSFRKAESRSCRSGSLWPVRRRAFATGRRRSVTVAPGAAGSRIGCSARWAWTIAKRVPELKCLLLRKVGKANLEHFEDLRRNLFTRLGHEFSAFRGILSFHNGSRIIAGHFQNEKDIDAYLGLEYDVIGIEEATTLTSRKYQDITTCCRSSKPNWRPRICSTTNPGGVGHGWYRKRFIEPWQRGAEAETHFIAARVTDNRWNNPEYIQVLQGLSGWQRRSWLDGDWDIAAGQFFTTLRREVHVVEDFDDTRAREWWAALDYGYAHYTF